MSAELSFSTARLNEVERCERSGPTFTPCHLVPFSLPYLLHLGKPYLLYSTTCGSNSWVQVNFRGTAIALAQRVSNFKKGLEPYGNATYAATTMIRRSRWRNGSLQTAFVFPSLSRLRALGLATVLLIASTARANQSSLDDQLSAVLEQAGFTGRVESTLETRLGRPIDPKLANLGRLLFFDKLHSLHHDNACAGCHSPTNGFGDTQSIAIGIQNNNLVGPRRTGPRNQRRTPMAANTAFYPALMWNGRFNSRPVIRSITQRVFTFRRPKTTRVSRPMTR